MADRKLTDLELERHLAGDLPEARMSVATADDKQRLEELRAEHAAFLSTVDVDAEVRAIGKNIERATPPPRVRLWWRWVLSGGALAAAAAVLLLYLTRDRGASDDDLSVKGDGVSLVIHASSGQRLQTGDIVHPGERIRFEINAGKPGFVAVVGVDGANAVTIYYPYGANAPAAIDPASERLLPGAIQLDATLGDEHFYALYSTKPFAIDALVPVIRSGAQPPAGVGVAQVVLRKQ